MASELTKILRKGFRASFSIYLAMFVGMITSIPSSIILVRGLTREEYGVFQLINSIIFVGTIFCGLGLDSTLSRFGAELVAIKNLKRLIQFFKKMVLFRTVALIVFGIGFFSLQKFITEIFNLPQKLVHFFPIVVFVLFFSSLNRLWGTSFLACRLEQTKESINRIIVSIFKVAGFVYVLWRGFGLEGIVSVLVGMTLFSTVFYGIVYWNWYKHVYKNWLEGANKSDFDHHDNFTRRVVRFALITFFAGGVFTFRELQVDNLLISRYLNPEYVALYGLAAQMVGIVTTLNPPSILRGIFQTILVNRYLAKNDLNELIWGHAFLTKITIFIMLPAYTVLALLAERTIVLIYSSEYVGATIPLMWLCSFSFFSSMTKAFHSPIIVLEKNELFLISGVFSLYNLIMDILLIPKYGIVGAAIATGSAGMLTTFYYWAAFRCYIKLKLIFPWKALLQVLANVVPVIVLCIIAKPFISNVFLLIMVCIISASMYLSLSYVNNIFDVQEMNLFKRAIGRRCGA